MSGLFRSAANPSGTYEFFPSSMEVIASAYARIQVRRTELEPSHIQDGISELNLFLAAFNDAGPNLAQVDLQTQSLTDGTATYNLPVETVMVMDVFLSYTSGSDTLDTYMYPISRTEYAALPNKATEGKPTQYWLDRQATPTITLYPVPDSSDYTLNYYRMRQVQDATVANGVTPEVPNRALDALVAGLAYRLARVYAPNLEAARKADAAEAWAIYARQDTENVPLYLTPALAQYWRP